MDLQQLYDDLYSEGYHENNKNHGLKYVGSLLFKCKFRSFLDVGCSQGAMVKTMQVARKVSHGVDISTQAIRQSKKLGLTTCRVANADTLPYRKDSFDLVFSSETLEHLPKKQVKKAIYELLRVSKKYVAVKIAYEPEINRDWVDKANEKGYIINDLHLTIKEESFWRNLFENGTNWKAWYEYDGMIVFRKQKEKREHI